MLPPQRLRESGGGSGAALPGAGHRGRQETRSLRVEGRRGCSGGRGETESTSSLRQLGSARPAGAPYARLCAPLPPERGAGDGLGGRRGRGTPAGLPAGGALPRAGLPPPTSGPPVDAATPLDPRAVRLLSGPAPGRSSRGRGLEGGKGLPRGKAEDLEERSFGPDYTLWDDPRRSRASSRPAMPGAGLEGVGPWQRRGEAAEVPSLPTVSRNSPRSLVQVSQRRAPEDFTCRRVASYDMSLIRLWLLGFVACERSIELTPKWLWGADRLMTTPLMLMMTPLQELRFLLFRQVYRLASAEYHSSLLCGEEGSQVTSECRKDVSTRKKRRRQRKQPAVKAPEQAPIRITPAGSHVEDLNIGLAPSEVTQRQITATETHVLVLHLLRETIDEILCHVSDDVLQTSPLSAQPLFPVQDRDPEPVLSSTSAAPESEFCAPDEPFESNFSTYSLWLSGGLMWRAPLVIPQPVESSLEKGSDEQFGFFWDNPSNQEGALGVIEDEAEGDLVALTTAALRAHTVFYESQIANGAAETRRKNSWSLRNKSDGYPTAGKGGHHSKRDPQAVASPSKYPSSTLRYFYPKGLLVQ